MPTPSGHTTAILASKVSGSSVYNAAREKIGHVEDIVLDKTSDKIMFAVLGFGGFLGIGEKFHAVPWNILDFDKDQGGYVVNLTRETLEAAPVYDLDDLTRQDGTARASSQTYYAPFM
jgi:sporulation protein YlmC with PRC-barrel domain